MDDAILFQNKKKQFNRRHTTGPSTFTTLPGPSKSSYFNGGTATTKPLRHSGLPDNDLVIFFSFLFKESTMQKYNLNV